jgi:hypothetical protein
VGHQQFKIAQSLAHPWSCVHFTLNPDPYKTKGPAPKGVLAVDVSATRLVSKLKAKLRGADYDVGRLPEKVGMDGNDAEFAVLLNKQELESAVCRS